MTQNSGEQSPPIPFHTATAIESISSHTYTANFPLDWCIGTVPHGGFVTTCFQRVARAHFSTTLKSQNQPHTITLHLEFVRRTQVGYAKFVVRDVKLGRQTSTIHITMMQPTEDDGSDRLEVEGYITNANFATEAGPSFDTKWKLHPPPAEGNPSTFMWLDDKLDGNANWKLRQSLPFPEFRKAVQRVEFCVERSGYQRDGIMDLWMRLNTGQDPPERFTNESLGFVCDMFPQMVEGLMERNHRGELVDGPFWYPTVCLNLDVKKALPEHGVEWLFIRVESKKIKNGRYDLEVVVLDEEQSLVAISNHVSLVVSGSRNIAKRRSKITNEEREMVKESKL